MQSQPFGKFTWLLGEWSNFRVAGDRGRIDSCNRGLLPQDDLSIPIDVNDLLGREKQYSR
jgi:hypothetical protein